MLDHLRIIYLISYLNDCTKAYDLGAPKISDEEWDKLYFELKELEEKTGLIYPNSPTQSINYEVVNKLVKREHNHSMLSLDKTKSLEDIKNFLSNKDYLAMCKMDGLTCSLTYQDGKLVSAETRGDGKIGEDVLHNAKIIGSIPASISYKDKLIIDGEIICTYNNFEEFSSEYKNPRNFAAGSIRLLDSSECSKRKLTFIPWEVITPIYSEGQELNLKEKFDFLSKLGFQVVPYRDNGDLESQTEELKSEAKKLGYPIDGIVFKFNDCAFGRTLGETSHHARNAMAFKFYDEAYPTKLIKIEWGMGRTGQITPVAIFEPVEIDGSVVSRASLHNLSVYKETLHGYGWEGQSIEVVKKNMIIPQIEKAQKNDLNKQEFILPQVCPICGEPVSTKCENNSEILVCTNKNCEGQLINQLEHFFGKSGLDVKGLSKATLEKLIEWNWVNEPSDIFELKNFKDVWMNKQGFGKKSVENILAAIENSKALSLEAFISAIGIPLIGKSVSKDLVKYVDSYEDLKEKIANKWNFTKIPGFAENKTYNLYTFDFSKADKVYPYLTIKKPEEEKEKNNNLQEKKFAITGHIKSFKNRAELQKYIESLGGKVVSSVSKNTNYLINNDKTSTSSKNKTAEKLGVPIITEDEFFDLLKNF